MKSSDIKTGIVVIGRNEGDRLKRCLQSVLPQTANIVYVDSGSSDGSVDYARLQKIEVVELDMSVPFSAGRARNIGFDCLLDKHPDLELVQFIDGDCELLSGWIDAAVLFLAENSGYAIVTGRVKERYPERSLYNWLCDIEWAKEPGDILSCGGIFMVRVPAFRSVDGFNASMIAGEEPELCYRLRQRDWRLHSLSRLMTLHDANILHFYQWWKRMIRGGYAYAQGYYLHRKEKNPHQKQQTIRIVFWAAVIPLFTLSSFFLIGFWAFLFLGLYPAQVLRLVPQMTKRGGSFYGGLLLAFFNVLLKFPQFFGILQFYKRKFLSEKQHIIEYK